MNIKPPRLPATRPRNYPPAQLPATRLHARSSRVLKRGRPLEEATPLSFFEILVILAVGIAVLLIHPRIAIAGTRAASKITTNIVN